MVRIQGLKIAGGLCALCFLAVSVTMLVFTLMGENPFSFFWKPPQHKCLLTEKTYKEGARCEGAPYRKTGDWCCSEYGRKKLYKWTFTPANE